jgi:hypothetical protein
MRSEFLTKNKGLLRFCAGVARFCGLFALLGTAVLTAVMIVVTVADSGRHDAVAQSRTQLVMMVPHIVFYGLAALILAEFITYLLAEQGEPKWILRHGDKIIYGYILYVIASWVFYAAHSQGSGATVGGVPFYDNPLHLALAIAFILVRALIWIGLAIVLRKIVPIIRESKTLV